MSDSLKNSQQFKNYSPCTYIYYKNLHSTHTTQPSNIVEDQFYFLGIVFLSYPTIFLKWHPNSFANNLLENQKSSLYHRCAPLQCSSILAFLKAHFCCQANKSFLHYQQLSPIFQKAFILSILCLPMLHNKLSLDYGHGKLHTRVVELINNYKVQTVKLTEIFTTIRRK